MSPAEDMCVGVVEASREHTVGLHMVGEKSPRLGFEYWYLDIFIEELPHKFQWDYFVEQFRGFVSSFSEIKVS